jgi:hypothetical protein
MSDLVFCGTLLGSYSTVSIDYEKQLFVYEDFEPTSDIAGDTEIKGQMTLNIQDGAMSIVGKDGFPHRIQLVALEFNYAAYHCPFVYVHDRRPAVTELINKGEYFKAVELLIEQAEGEKSC